MAVQVEVFPDTVEIFSPGWFPEGHTPEAHLAGKDTSPLSPNKLIANTLFKSKDIESFATGLPRIQKLCNEEGIAFHYQKTPHGTKVVFERKDPFASLASTNSGNDVEFPTGTSRAEMRESSGKFGKVREKLGKELSAEELTVTEYAETNGSITSAKAMELTGFTDRGSQLLLKRLVEKGILNKVGAGRNTRYVLGDIVSGR